MLPSRPDLADAADRNLATHFAWVHRHLPSMRVAEWPDVTLTDSGLRNDTFNAACCARFAPGTAPRRVAAVRDWFGEARDDFSWWTSPGDRPADLGALLVSEAGLVPAEAELAMAADLGAAPLHRLPPADLEIRRVATAEDLAAFSRVAAANWSPPDQLVVEFYRLGQVPLLRPDAPLWFYLGLVDSAPVATAEATVAGGVAGLYNVATMAEWRGRGYGTAMTSRPLRDARAAGVGTAILQAAPDGVGIYRRLGFEVFGEVIEYKPRR